ncbi:hypothetical protein Efla_000583 [Eimeria flavescens]
MGLFFRNREEDLADPDLRASRYFLFKNKQTEENKLKNAEKKYGYTVGELHAYRHLMKPPQMPERMQEERPEMKTMYDNIHRLVDCEVYVQQTENHFATPPPAKPAVKQKATGEAAPQSRCECSKSSSNTSNNSSNSSNINSSNSSNSNSNSNSGSSGSSTASSAGVDESCVKCLGYYLALDRCVRAVSAADEKHRVYKYTRLHACKPHWVWFKRCTGYRDQQLLKEICSWEEEHFKSLGAAER